MSRLPVIAIVGRPNVGKSTLFNRLARRRLAIVDDEPGVTRDRLYALARPPGARFHLVDTGGLDPESTDVFFMGIKEQVRLAVEEADAIVHLLDARAGLHPDDRYVMEMLRKSGKPLLTVANKIDGRDSADLLPEIYELGVDRVLGISSAHGTGVADMVDALLEMLPAELKAAAIARAEADAAVPRGRAARRAAAQAAEAAEAEEAAEAAQAAEASEGEDLEAPEPDAVEVKEEVRIPAELRVAVVGRPNAGKSSLVNAILGEPRLMVSEIPGTTRDAVDTKLERDGKAYVLVDTAGLRRKSTVARRLEKFSVLAAVRALENADIVLIVVDGYEGVTEQDAKIGQLANDAGKGIIIVVNKWDLVQAEARNREHYTERVRRELGFISFAPVLFVSALKNEGIPRVLDTVDTVAQNHYRRVSTSRINKAFQRAMDSHHLPSFKGKRVSLYYATQLGVAPPLLVVACNTPEGVHFSYRRYLLNSLREQFELVGSPLKIIFRRRGKVMGRTGHTHRKRSDPRQHGG